MFHKLLGRGDESPSSPASCLEVLKPSELARRIPLGSEPFLIGRDEACNLRFDFPDVSRQHARIFPMGDEWLVEDLGSKNGVILNGKQVGKFSLADGDVVKIGNIVIRFHLERQSAQPSDLNIKKLLDVSIAINSTLVPEEVLQRIIDSVAQISGAERSCLMLVDERGSLEMKVAHNMELVSVDSSCFVISRSVARQTADTRRPVIMERIPEGEGSESIVALGLKTVVCLPLLHKDRVLGVIYTDSRRSAWIRELDLHILESLASYAAVALENARLNQQLKETFFNTSMALAEAIEARDNYTAGHSRRVTEYSLMIGKALGLSNEDLDFLHIGSILHDVGKIGIEDCVLRKPAPLDRDEYAEIKEHPAIGAKILGHVPQLSKVVPAVRSHHERMDGLGYPDGLIGEQIPLLARIIAVADAFDAMTSTRVYRRKLSIQHAIDELQEGMGTQFDERIVKVFLEEFKAKRIAEGQNGEWLEASEDRGPVHGDANSAGHEREFYVDTIQ